MAFFRASMAAAAALVLAACSQAATGLPVQQSVDPVASNTLQVAVGVATISNQGQSKPGLNVVETLRQSNGLSGTLYNIPAITGPAGFAIASQTISSSISPPLTALARADFNTNRITQQTFDTQNATGYNQALPFATTGAFGYGFCPCNSNSAPVTGQPQLFHAYFQPLDAVLPYGDFKTGQFLANLQYYGGPPAFPSPSPDQTTAGFVGYSTGFTDFAVAPVTGTYRLDVAVPPNFYGPNSTPTPQPSPSQSPVPTLSANAKLTSTAGLPPFPTPQFASDARGGGTIVLNVPAGVTETLAFIQEGIAGSPVCSGAILQPVFYTFFVKGAGVHAVTVPDSIGPNGEPTICSQAPYFVYAAGFDYPAYEAAYPQSASQTPQIAGANGQADVTTSDAFAGTY